MFDEIVKELRGKVSDEQLDSDLDIYNNSDPTTALECLCSQIDDNEVKISKQLFDKIAGLCSAKGVETSYLDDIKPYIIG